MNVNVIPEELTLDALKGLTQNRNKYETTEASKTDTDSFGLLNLDSYSISAADVVGKNDNESPADGAPIQREEATHTSVVGSCEDTTIDASISESVSSVTVETKNAVSSSVRAEGGSSSNSSIDVRMEEGSTSDTLPVAEGASNSTKMEEGTSSITSSKVECDASNIDEISDESVAKPSVCSPKKSTVAEEMTADAQVLNELPEDSIQTEKSASSITLTTDRNTSSVGETSERAIDSGGTPKTTTVGKVCDLTKSEGNPKPSEGGLDEKKREKIRARRKVINEKIAELKTVGRRFCEERKIAFPNMRTFRNLVYDLDKVQKLDEENLKIVLEAAAQRKRDSFSTDPNKTVGGQPAGELSESAAKLLIDSEFESRQSKGEEVESRYEAFRLVAHEYCEVNRCLPPNRRIFKTLLLDLLNKKQLDEKNLKIALDMHIKLMHCRVEFNRFKQIGSDWERSPAVAIVEAEKGKILPSVVKPLSEMTTEERIAFFEEFQTLHIKMKPIAIEHCHTIKSPFPKVKVFYMICRDLFEAGMLDEENVKLCIEKVFEEKCKGSLTDEQLCFILRHYCADNGIDGYSLKRMRNEILPKIPNELTTLKQYWALMHKDRKTNLFLDENLAHPETAKLLEEDLERENSKLAASQPDKQAAGQPAASQLTPSHQQNGAAPSVQKNVAMINGDVEPRLRLSGIAKPKPRRSNLSSASPFNGNLHGMGLSWSNSMQNKGREHKRGPWNVRNSGATSSSYTNPSLSKFSQGLNEEPIQQLLIQTKQGIAEKTQMLRGGLDGQDRNAIQQYSWGRKNSVQPQNSEPRKLPYWKKIQAQPFSQNSFEIRGQCQPRTGRLGAMSVPNQTNLLEPPIFRPPPQLTPSLSALEVSLRSYFPEPKLPAQNLMTTNIRTPGPSSAQPAWPLCLENRSFRRTDISNDDYSQNSGIGEQSSNQGAVFGHSLGHDPLVGTSEQRWSERERFDPPRKNMTDYDEPSSPNQQGQSRWKIRDNDWRRARDAPHDNDGRFTRDVPHDNDGRFTRDAPPQKKSRFDEDRQPETSQSSHLESAMKEFDDWMAKNTKQSSEPMNPSDSSRKNRGRASPPRALMPVMSEMPTVKEIPPFVVPGKTCKVAIVHEDYPRRWLTDQEAELIRDALLGCIGRHSGIAAPRFTDTYEERGAVIFECEDQLTVSWVWLNASTITPWRSAKLRTISWEKSPKEISIEVPKQLQSLTPLALCERLMSQNPGLSTHYWKLKSADLTSSKGQNLVFSIDGESMETLKSLDLRPYLGLSRVKIHINRE